MKLVTQEHPMGCAVACVAARSNTTYQDALTFFSQPSNAWTRGFYCSEIVEALYGVGYSYSYAKFNEARHQKYLNKNGTIIFLERNEIYPDGHFFIRCAEGWMNPWFNFPQILDVHAKFQNNLPGTVQYIIFEN